jgi:predicted HTH transcriptional regulator
MEIGRSLWLHESKNGFFYRHADSKRKMSIEHILRLGQSRSQARIIPFDEQLVPNTHYETLEKPLYQRFIPNEISDDETNNFLLKRHLLIKESNYYRATVAGLLMCSQHSDDYLYNSFICAVCYSGTEKDANYQIDAQDFKGTLDQQIVDAFSFVKKNNQVSALKDIGRIDQPQYSMKAVFEAIVNAVIHRDYSKHGSKIRLFIFKDRLELYSPGVLANSLTVENLRYNQMSRNELLGRLLSELSLDDNIAGQIGRKHFLERRGEGVGIILKESLQLSSKEPTYKVLSEELRLIIFAAKSLQEK